MMSDEKRQLATMLFGNHELLLWLESVWNALGNIRTSSGILGSLRKYSFCDTNPTFCDSEKSSRVMNLRRSRFRLWILHCNQRLFLTQVLIVLKQTKSSLEKQPWTNNWNITNQMWVELIFDATPDMATNAGFFDDLIDFRARNIMKNACFESSNHHCTLVGLYKHVRSLRTGSQRGRKKNSSPGFQNLVFANARFSCIVEEMQMHRS